ncbi:MAG: transporter substrate-binding domain-containing protein [Oscillospiraceae bacterium]|nr:transporter substrate-binding domain-containing protein [Oscillospiraceae bacterium]
MKKIISVILAVALMAVCFAGCGSQGLTVADIQKAGKLTIATSPDFPPFEYLDENGQPTGIEIEIMELICQELGVELVIEQMNFDSVLPGVQAGKYDVGVSGISVTPDREKNTLFTDPYCLAAQAIVVLNGSPITCKADLEGKTIAVQSGTTAEAYALENGYTFNPYAANTDAQEALLAGKVDAWVIDDLTAAEMVALYNEANPGALVVLGEAMTTEPYAFAFKQGNDELVNAINEIINKLVADGTVAEIFAANNAPYTAPAQG